MDWTIFITVIVLCIGVEFIVIQIKNIVRLAIYCKREGVKAVKYHISLLVILVIGCTIWLGWSTIDSFIKANEASEVAAFSESKIGTEYVEDFVKKE